MASEPGLARLRAALMEYLGAERVRTNEPLARHTFYRIGGPADLFISVRSIGELVKTVALARQAKSPYFILGAGSNILVSDSGLCGLVIENRTKGMRLESRGSEAVVKVESGRSLGGLAREMADQGWAGLAWACGIPGTVGGGVVQNAGAHGGSMAQVLTNIDILDEQNTKRSIPASELELDYRSSIFKKRDCRAWVILLVEINLRRGDPAELRASIAAYNDRRRARQPAEASCGSVFKNPPGDYAGRLIEAAGLKGQRVGGAEISPLHANFIVNKGGATAADVMTLIDQARRAVCAEFDVGLELEIELIGEWQA